jgi:hypothetical protein
MGRWNTYIAKTISPHRAQPAHLEQTAPRVTQSARRYRTIAYDEECERARQQRLAAR